MEYEDEYIMDEEEDEEASEDIEENDFDHEYTDEYSSNYKKEVDVQEIIGTGAAETTIETRIPLIPPAIEIAQSLIKKKVIFDVLTAAKNKVFVKGRVIKDIPYKSKAQALQPGSQKISRLIFGSVKHVTAEIPFELCIDAKGSVKGGRVVILKSKVDSAEILNPLGTVPHDCISFGKPSVLKFNNCNKRLFRSITEKECIFVKVKVVKQSTIVTLPHKQNEEY